MLFKGKREIKKNVSLWTVSLELAHLARVNIIFGGQIRRRGSAWSA